MSGQGQESLEIWFTHCSSWVILIAAVNVQWSLKRPGLIIRMACLALLPCTLALHRETPICGIKAPAPARANKKLSYTKWGFSSRCFGRRFSFSCNKTPLSEFFWTHYGQKVLRLQCLQILQTFKRRLFCFLCQYLQLHHLQNAHNVQVKIC